MRIQAKEEECQGRGKAEVNCGVGEVRLGTS